ncbi:radical SAM protein [Haloferula helveola]
MSGSAILTTPEETSVLHTVTVTVNNACNLRCTHCYLQYQSDTNELLDPKTVTWLAASEFAHIAIVGKEPLANRRSAEFVSQAVEQFTRSGKSVSLITNGLNARLLGSETVQQLAWIDISVDGGIESFGRHGRGPLASLERAVDHFREKGCKKLRSLNTISAANIKDIPDILSLSDHLDFDLTIFAPYFRTASLRPQYAEMVAPSSYLKGFASINLEKRAGKVVILIGSKYFDAFNESRSDSIKAMLPLMQAGILKEIDGDPIDRGLMRVTFDDLVLKPLESLHTVGYQGSGRRVNRLQTAEETFARLRN